jgi:hypothetical protein
MPFDEQVMRLGAPVTALTLSPGMDMLATAHASARGIYLWSNQLLFGGASDILPSQVLKTCRTACIDAGFHVASQQTCQTLELCALAALLIAVWHPCDPSP